MLIGPFAGRFGDLLNRILKMHGRSPGWVFFSWGMFLPDQERLARWAES
jgi:hypothetical protein